MAAEVVIRTNGGDSERDAKLLYAEDAPKLMVTYRRVESRASV